MCNGWAWAISSEATTRNWEKRFLRASRGSHPDVLERRMVLRLKASAIQNRLRERRNFPVPLRPEVFPGGANHYLCESWEKHSLCCFLCYFCGFLERAFKSLDGTGKTAGKANE